MKKKRMMTTVKYLRKKARVLKVESVQISCWGCLPLLHSVCSCFAAHLYLPDLKHGHFLKHSLKSTLI